MSREFRIELHAELIKPEAMKLLGSTERNINKIRMVRMYSN